MNFRFLSGDINRTLGAKWISPRLNNGDWDYWLVIELVNCGESGGEEMRKELGKYLVTISAVSPKAAGKKNVQQALDCIGWNNDLRLTNEVKVEALSTYGVASLVKSVSGNNSRRLLKQLRDEATVIEGLLGFYMDGPKNALGHTGWDFIRGDLSLKTAERNRERFATA